MLCFVSRNGQPSIAAAKDADEIVTRKWGLGTADCGDESSVTYSYVEWFYRRRDEWFFCSLSPDRVSSITLPTLSERVDKTDAGEEKTAKRFCRGRYNQEECFSPRFISRTGKRSGGFFEE